MSRSRKESFFFLKIVFILFTEEIYILIQNSVYEVGDFLRDPKIGVDSGSSWGHLACAPSKSPKAGLLVWSALSVYF